MQHKKTWLGSRGRRGSGGRSRGRRLLHLDRIRINASLPLFTLSAEVSAPPAKVPVRDALALCVILA